MPIVVSTKDKSKLDPLAEALRRATESYGRSGEEYGKYILGGGTIRDALSRAANEADPSLGQLRGAKADVSKRLGTVFADSMDSLKDITDPRIREQIRARQSSEFGSEGERLGGLISDVGGSRDRTVDKFANVFGALTGAKQFDVEQKRTALDRATSASDKEESRRFESRMDDLTRREKEASIAASNRSNRGGGGAGNIVTFQEAVASPLLEFLSKGGRRVQDQSGGYQFFDKSGQPITVDQASAMTTAGTKADFLAGSKNKADETYSGAKPSITAAAQKDINSISDALNVIKTIEGTSGKINTETGPLARLGGILRYGKSTVGLDPAATAFKSNVGYLSRVVRAMGEVGTLNEGDIARAKTLIPGIGDTKEEAANKISALRELLNRNLQQRQNPSGFSADPTLQDVLDTGV